MTDTLADTTTIVAPTDDELAAARTVLARAAAAEQARLDAQVAPLKEMVNDLAFQPLLAKAKTLEASFGDGIYRAHLNCMVQGMDELAKLFPST